MLGSENTERMIMINRFLVLFLVLIIINSGSTQDLAVDHLYIIVKNKAPEAVSLQKIGLNIPVTSVHEGQGTASVSFLFYNFYLELIWVDNPEMLSKADSNLAQKFNASKSGGSPFGLGLRRVNPKANSLPFPTYSYFAEWMKPGTTIEMSYINQPNEPEIFIVPPYLAWNEQVKRVPQILAEINNDLDLKNLSGIRIIGPGLPTISDAIVTLINQNLVKFESGDSHLVELIFDNGQFGKTINVRPELPLVIKY